MKILNRQVTEDKLRFISRYDFDQLIDVNDLSFIINSLVKSGYQFHNFSPRYEIDHSDYKPNPVYYSFEELCESFGNGCIPLDVDNIIANGVYMNDKLFHLDINLLSKCFAVSTQKKSIEVDLNNSAPHL